MTKYLASQILCKFVARQWRIQGGFKVSTETPLWNSYTLIEQSDRDSLINQLNWDAWIIVALLVINVKYCRERKYEGWWPFCFWSSTQTELAFLSSWNWNPLSKILDPPLLGTVHEHFLPCPLRSPFDYLLVVTWDWEFYCLIVFIK